MLLSVDVETKCGVGCETSCDHALDPRRNAITVIGTAYQTYKGEYRTHVFRSVPEFQKFLYSHGDQDLTLLGFNFKFDYETLIAKGLNISLSWWEHDASLMASVYTKKVDPEYVEQYEVTRRELNAKLPKGKGHRRTSGGSLKILAPYFLGVEPFWEATADHDNDEYVTKDALYTLQLFEHFKPRMKEEGGYEFYKHKLMEWTKLLVRMEMRGIAIDFDKMAVAERDALRRSIDAKANLDMLWTKANEAYYKVQLDELADKYLEMRNRAIAKVDSEVKRDHLRLKYEKLYQNALPSVSSTLNIDSPSQMKWLLKDYFKLDVTDFHDEESTGKPVLKRLANEGREDIRQLLEYREQKKLLTAFFPSYRDMALDGVLHCSFNPTATRTGRLSSSGPNLQQVPRGLHNLFVARPGYKLIVRDQAAIEPRLIAYVSEDPTIYTLLHEGADFHGYNTKIFFDLDCALEDVKGKYPLQREVGKEVGLAIMYGAGAMRLQESAQKRGFVWTEGECRSKVKRFREEYSAVGEYQKALNLQLESGIMFNLFGRPFRVDDPRDIHMKGLNTLIQGSASDMVLNNAYRAQMEFDVKGIDAHVLLLVHDEIVLEVAQDQVEQATEIIDRCMTDYQLTTRWGDIKLKVEGKTGDAWEK